MSTVSIAPVQVTPDDLGAIENLGVRAAYLAIVERIRAVVPALTHIEVVLQDRLELGEPDEPPTVILRAFSSASHQPPDDIWSQLADWKRQSFPPQVWGLFQIRIFYEN